MKVKIKKLRPDIELPKYHTKESAGFDLASAVDIIIQPNEVVKIPTGLAVEAPSGHFLLLAARSSLPFKKGLAKPNGIGVVDPDYAGPEDEINLIFHNITSQPVEVKKGERLAQGIFIKADQVEWEEVQQLRAVSRGGVGSTGGYK